MSTKGIERRRHVVYITRNTEYHCRDRECVAVRTRSTGQWQRRHVALRSTLMGTVDPKKQLSAKPNVGHRLYFRSGSNVLTSPVLASGRPEREDLFWYANLVKSGVIAHAR